MGDTPKPAGDDTADALLEEKVEPAESSGPSEPLAADTVLTGARGESVRVTSVVRGDPAGSVYEAVLTLELEDQEDKTEEKKVWLREACDEAGAVRLRREAEVLAGIESRMLPQVFGCFEENGRTYLMTDPPNGDKTFAEMLVEGGAPAGRLLSYLAQVASALGKLHEHGWVHLGVRPSTVVVGKPVKLLDFSFAAKAGEKPAGSFYHAGYSPPELLSGEPVDPRSDIYAVGALLFHAINGKPLGEAGAELSTWQPAVPVAGVPQILNRCLCERKDRYANMSDLHRSLLRLAARTSPTFHYEIGAVSSIGLEPTRTTNQDSYVHLSGRLESEGAAHSWATVCVADGIGGMSGGDIASEAACRAVASEAVAAFALGKPPSADDQVRLAKKWVQSANDKVCDALDAKGLSGGCTIIIAALLNNRLTIGHVGDCRIYRFRNGEPTLLSRDHSLAMALVNQGEIEMEQVRGHGSRSTVTRSLGGRRPLPDYFIDGLEQGTGAAVMDLADGDVIAVFCDGLWEPVVESEMTEILAKSDGDLQAAAEQLAAAALRHGGSDNTTAVLLRVREARSI